MCARINTLRMYLPAYSNTVMPLRTSFLYIDTNLCERKLLQKIGLKNGKQCLPNTLIIQTYKDQAAFYV